MAVCVGRGGGLGDVFNYAPDLASHSKSLPRSHGPGKSFFPDPLLHACVIMYMLVLILGNSSLHGCC